MGSYSYGVFLTTPGGNQAHYHSVIYTNPATITGLALNNAGGVGVVGTVYVGTTFPPPPVPSWSLVNQGTIIGAIGVDLPNGGRVDNVPGNPNGGITGGGYGVIIGGAVGTVSNRGQINGDAAIQGYHTIIVPTQGYGVALDDGGLVTNGTAIYTTALIRGHDGGVFIGGGPGTVTNYATIMGNTRGIYLAAGGTVTNTWNFFGASRSAIRGDSIGVLITGGSGQISNGGILRGAFAIDGHSPVDVTNTGAIYGISLSGQAGIAGIYLLAGGTINNTYRTTLVNNGTEGDYTELRQIGTINGAAFGIEAGDAPATVTNFDEIDSDTDNGVGIELSAGGLVTNGGYQSNYRGTITGPTAIIIQGSAGMLDNEAGSTILSTGSYSSGFAAEVSGTVLNAGIISAKGAGVLVSEVISAGTTILPTFANTGYVTAKYAAVSVIGVSGKPAAQFVNAGGFIQGGNYGAALSDVTGTVTNDGVIRALGGVYPYFTATGLAMSNSDGTITNGNSTITSADIYGKFLGLYVHDGTDTITNYGSVIGGTGISTYGGTHDSTIINFGTIASRNGTNGTAIAFGRGNSELVDEPGAVFIGGVIGGSGTNVLTLASGLDPGTASGLGTYFKNFSSIYVAPGGHWYIDGSNFNALTSTGGIFEDSGVVHVRSDAAFANDGTFVNLTTFEVDPHALFSNAGSEQGGITIQSDGTLHNNWAPLATSPMSCSPPAPMLSSATRPSSSITATPARASCCATPVPSPMGRTSTPPPPSPVSSTVYSKQMRATSRIWTPTPPPPPSPTTPRSLAPQRSGWRAAVWS